MQASDGQRGVSAESLVAGPRVVPSVGDMGVLCPRGLEAKTDAMDRSPRVLLFNVSVLFHAGLYGSADHPGSGARRWISDSPGLWCIERAML